MTTTAETAAELPTELTISYLVSLKKTAEYDDAVVDLESALGCSTVDSKRIGFLTAYLRNNGVVVEEHPRHKLEDYQIAVREMLRPSFWPKHAALHPHYTRVKNWLWVHSRYRDQAKAMLSSEGESQKAAFETLHDKIESHSEFEDTQLFKYFVEHQQDKNETLKENLAKLKHQHEDLRLAETIRQAMKEGSSEIQKYLETYVQELMNHMQLEEETLVGTWLQMSAEDYKMYRSYLSWKYWFMY